MTLLGVILYADYKDDGQIFNGSISSWSYLGNGLLGFGIGALIGLALSGGISLSIPTFQFLTNSIGGISLVSTGTATLTISGTQILHATGVVGALVMFAKTWKSGGYKIKHYSNDHEPAHVHIFDDDIKGDIRVDLFGDPLKESHHYQLEQKRLLRN